jgi:hypothetical protein
MITFITTTIKRVISCLPQRIRELTSSSRQALDWKHFIRAIEDLMPTFQLDVEYPTVNMIANKSQQGQPQNSFANNKWNKKQLNNVSDAISDRERNQTIRAQSYSSFASYSRPERAEVDTRRRSPPTRKQEEIYGDRDEQRDRYRKDIETDRNDRQYRYDRYERENRAHDNHRKYDNEDDDKRYGRKNERRRSQINERRRGEEYRTSFIDTRPKSNKDRYRSHLNNISASTNRLL